MERLARDKHSNLLRKSVNYTCKKFYSTAPCFAHLNKVEGFIKSSHCVGTQRGVVEEHKKCDQIHSSGSYEFGHTYSCGCLVHNGLAYFSLTPVSHMLIRVL